MFASSGGVNFNHFDLVFNFVKFLVHHDNFDDEAGAGVKPDYFSQSTIQLPGGVHG